MADLEDRTQADFSAGPAPEAQAEGERPHPLAKPDEDGACSVCGLAWPDARESLEQHICPPGFTRPTHPPRVSETPNASEVTSANEVPSGEARDGFYVASRVKHADMWKRYRTCGLKINSSWIDEAGDGETEDFAELWARIEVEIRRSSALVLYVLPNDFPLKGALVEVGMALAHGVPVYVVAPGVVLEGRTLRPVGSWLLDARVKHVESIQAAIAAQQRKEGE